MAICSDIDRTTTLERFLAIQEFLKATRNTSMGPGTGLEIGNSFFADRPYGSFPYLSNRSAEREFIETLVEAGQIDCLHLYGDGAPSRAHALRGLKEFELTVCKVDVWVGRVRAPCQLGANGKRKIDLAPLQLA